MSEHRISLNWTRHTADFNIKTYSRDHVVNFSGGESLDMSAAPAYRGNPNLADPEALLVAAVSSCHCLTFLALAARAGLVIDHYADDAMGFLEKNDNGKMAVTRIVLRPNISYAGATPDARTLSDLHEKAHEECFIANSVTTQVTVETPAVVS